jgi:hypothetical protein
MRASRLMFATTHWRMNEDTTPVGTTTLNRVAAAHRIEEQNRVLFEHLLTTRPAVVTNSYLRERARRLDEKRKTMSHFRARPAYPMPPLPRAFPLEEGLEDERSKVRLPALSAATPVADVYEVRERGWCPSSPRDLVDGAARRDGRLRGWSRSSRNAADSRTRDDQFWCNRETTHRRSMDAATGAASESRMG